jgi:hypothetical protein
VIGRGSHVSTDPGATLSACRAVLGVHANRNADPAHADRLRRTVAGSSTVDTLVGGGVAGGLTPTVVIGFAAHLALL